MICFFRFCGCFLLFLVLLILPLTCALILCMLILDLVYCANCGKVVKETDLSCKSFLKHYYISGNLDSY
jgi:hypothetical protein